MDETYMRLAIALAKKGAGRTSPNPAVGAVIVKKGRVVGTGYHKRCGLPHAEINALREAGRAAKGAAMYVTLEPCDHFGRTPPCTDAIVAAGIQEVVIAMKDPNPITSGRGVRKLKKAGIRTAVGLLAAEAAGVNKPFIKRVTKRMPYVTVKIAESLDGKIATKTGDSKWITGEDSRRYVHRLRASTDAVMVGAKTARTDDPLLLSVITAARQPVRVVVDSTLRLLPSAQIVATVRRAPVILATTPRAPRRKVIAFRKKGATVIIVRARNGRVDLRRLLGALARMGISDVLVEGGGELAGAFVEENLVDRFLFFIAPKIIGGARAVTAVAGRGVDKISKALTFDTLTIRRFKKDILIEAEVD